MGFLDITRGSQAHRRCIVSERDMRARTKEERLAGGIGMTLQMQWMFQLELACTRACVYFFSHIHTRTSSIMLISLTE